MATCPEQGKRHFEKWLESEDKDVRLILRENLKKKRLSHLDAEWVKRCQVTLEG